MSKSPEELLAASAESLLNNQAYKQAIIAIEAKVLTDFKKTKFFQKRHREECWRKLQTIDWLKKSLESMVQAGAYAKDKRDKQNRHSKLKGL